MTTTTFALPKPFDTHLHLRDGIALKTLVLHAAQRFGRAIIMPNLTPPVTTVEQALAYRARILAACPPALDFTPMMALYLTAESTPADIAAAAQSPHIVGFKLYPAGVTTHSEAGVDDILALYPLFAVMEKANVPLLIHGETNDPMVDIFDRERVFIEQHLIPLLTAFPHLKVTLEHITTQEAVDCVLAHHPQLSASVTPHHLLLNRNDLLAGGLKPHHYCLPILKRKKHQSALQNAVLSGHSGFFLGTDSAPHGQAKKESACGCAGIYTAHAAVELLVAWFAAAQALDRLPTFTSHFASQHYGWPIPDTTLTLTNKPWQVPATYPLGDDVLVPLFAGQTLTWQLNA